MNVLLSKPRLVEWQRVSINSFWQAVHALALSDGCVKAHGNNCVCQNHSPYYFKVRLKMSNALVKHSNKSLICSSVGCFYWISWEGYLIYVFQGGKMDPLTGPV